MTNPMPHLQQIIDADQIPLPRPAQAMANAIRAKHGGAVRALVFYGSALREGDDAGKMLDFYVIVDRYRSVYGRGFRSLAGWLLPPNVHFLQILDETGQKLRSKYAVISERAFVRRTRGDVLETMLWARFTQPAVIVADDAELHTRLRDTLAHAAQHFHGQVAPLYQGTVAAHEIWVRGLKESYRTELRPENADARAVEIVNRFPERYNALSDILIPRDTAGNLCLPDQGAYAQRLCRLRWFLRRILGKPKGAVRVLKSAATFDGGLDYVLEKVGDHSGVQIEVSPFERRHPVLTAPRIAWRLYRAGAFR